jgi:peptide/nickel transport system substrate-binding protein
VPFDDAHVRKAVSTAIEYNSIVNGPLAGYATEASGILAPNLGNWAAPTAPYYITDLDAATAEMAASANPDGFTTELIFDAANGTDALLAQIVKDNLAKIGIDVELTGLETLAFLDRAFTLDADMMLWSYGAISPDMSDPLGWIGGTGYLFTGFDQTAFDEQRTAYLTTVSADEKHDAVVAIQDGAFEQAAIIALAETPTVHAAASGLTGFAPAPWGLYYFDTIRNG